jgi:hypothetical protein
LRKRWPQKKEKNSVSDHTLGAGGLFWTDGSQQLASSHLSAVGLKKDGVEDKSLTWKTNHDPLFVFGPSDQGRV